jgi:hypothetical protein
MHGDSFLSSSGGIVHIKVLGRSMVFVNTAELAYELLEKRSSIYSDRCHLPMVVDLYVIPPFLDSVDRAEAV